MGRRSCFKNYCACLSALLSGSPSSCTPLYTPVVTRSILGARPFEASLQLFKIVPDDFVATVRLAMSALVTFLKQLRSGWGRDGQTERLWRAW